MNDEALTEAAREFSESISPATLAEDARLLSESLDDAEGGNHDEG